MLLWKIKKDGRRGCVAVLIVGAAGTTLFLLAMAQKHGLEINDDVITVGLEVGKYGMILWLMKIYAGVFL